MDYYVSLIYIEYTSLFPPPPHSLSLPPALILLLLPPSLSPLPPSLQVQKVTL